MNKKQPISTFERIMQNPERRKKFKVGYQRFLLSELLISWMENDDSSVRQLARELELSPTIIQALRRGKQTDLKTSNFFNLVDRFGYEVALVNKKTKKEEMTLAYENHHISAYAR